MFQFKRKPYKTSLPHRIGIQAGGRRNRRCRHHATWQVQQSTLEDECQYAGRTADSATEWFTCWWSAMRQPTTSRQSRSDLMELDHFHHLFRSMRAGANSQRRCERPDNAIGAASIRRWGTRVGIVLLFWLLPASGQAESPTSLQQRRIELHERRFDSQSQPTPDRTGSTNSASDSVRPTRFDPSRRYFFVPPARMGLVNRDTESTAGGPQDRQRANELFELAREALRQDQGSLAFQLAHEVLQYDPDHEDARRWLGLTGRQATAVQTSSIRPGRRPHPRYGWPVGQYQQVVTPHFQITTNDQQATVLQLARALEELQVVWEQLFFDCWSRAADLRARDTGPNRRRGRGAPSNCDVSRTRRICAVYSPDRTASRINARLLSCPNANGLLCGWR